MSSNAPSMPLFGDAYLADTRHLTLEEHGAYLQLMMIAWRSSDCALPDDDARLARMLGITAGRWAKLKGTVMAFWTLGENGWTQKRLSKERAFVAEKRAKNKSAADARWNGQTTENKGMDACERITERTAPPPSPPVVRREANASPSPASKSDLPARVLTAWNEGPAKRGAKRAIKLDAALAKHLNARIRDHSEAAVFDAIRGIAASDHHCGRTEKNWRAGLVWILESPGNFMKALEMAPADTGAPAADKTPEERIAQAQQMIGFNQRLGRESEVEEWTRKLIAAGGKPEPPPGNVAYIGQREQDQLKRMIAQ